MKNLLAPGIAPSSTVHAGSGEQLPLWRAAQRYANEGASSVIVAGERYGMGSSRDWAAKGVALLGIRAVLALGFERIHRSNLIGMGILPLRIPAEMSPAHLKLGPGDMIEIEALPEGIEPRSSVRIRIHRASGECAFFGVAAAIETSLEVETLKAGGMLPMILHREMNAHKTDAGTSPSMSALSPKFAA